MKNLLTRLIQFIAMIILLLIGVVLICIDKIGWLLEVLSGKKKMVGWILVLTLASCTHSSNREMVLSPLSGNYFSCPDNMNEQDYLRLIAKWRKEGRSEQELARLKEMIFVCIKLKEMINVGRR